MAVKNRIYVISPVINLVVQKTFSRRFLNAVNIDLFFAYICANNLNKIINLCIIKRGFAAAYNESLRSSKAKVTYIIRCKSNLIKFPAPLYQFRNFMIT